MVANRQMSPIPVSFSLMASVSQVVLLIHILYYSDHNLNRTNQSPFLSFMSVHVSYHAAWGQFRELSAWDSVSDGQLCLHYWNTSDFTVLLASILQPWRYFRLFCKFCYKPTFTNAIYKRRVSLFLTFFDISI